jgi:hypothetical protein
MLFAVPCLLISHLIPHGGWLLFWLKVGIASAIYVPIGLFVVLRRDEGMRIVKEAKAVLASIGRYLASRRRTRAGYPYPTAEGSPESVAIDGSRSDTVLP